MKRAGVPGGAPRRTDGLRTRHIPVLLSEVVESLAPRDNNLIIDGTFGAGGYSRAILDAANCRVLAFDRDITAVRAADDICNQYPDRLRLVNQPFGTGSRFCCSQSAARTAAVRIRCARRSAPSSSANSSSWNATLAMDPGQNQSELCL